MVELLQIIFRSFWTFFGTMLILGATFGGITSIVQSFRCNCKKLKEDNDAFKRGCDEYQNIINDYKQINN